MIEIALLVLAQAIIVFVVSRPEALRGPGYGFVAQPEQAGWKHVVSEGGADAYTSARMTVTVAAARHRNPTDKLPDTAKFFSGSVPGVRVSFTLPDGSSLTEMDGWQMAALNQKDGTLKNARGIRPEDLPLYTVGASLEADDDFFSEGFNRQKKSDPSNPVTLSDVFFRIGGATAGSATTSLRVDEDNVILDDVWARRADHGAGAMWSVNKADHGLIVNGDNVTALGLFVEH